MRLRFYDLEYRSDAPTTSADSSGRFREAVVAFPATYGTTVGEVSAYMWSDSDTYMHWGRDVFGWPVLRLPIHLDGDIWSGSPTPGATGTASIDLEDGSRASIRVDGTGADIAPPTPAAWITPRLIASPVEVVPAAR